MLSHKVAIPVRFVGPGAPLWGLSLREFQQLANDSAGSAIKPQECRSRRTHSRGMEDEAARGTPPEAEDGVMVQHRQGICV